MRTEGTTPPNSAIERLLNDMFPGCWIVTARMNNGSINRAVFTDKTSAEESARTMTGVESISITHYDPTEPTP